MPPTQSAIDPRLTTRNRQPGLDLLRALAIMLVIVYHAGLFGFAPPCDVQRFGWIGVRPLLCPERISHRRPIALSPGQRKSTERAALLLAARSC